MKHKLMHVDNLYDFSLVKYEPHSIILLDKNSGKPYQFYQHMPSLNLKPDLIHAYLSRPILYKNGMLYPRPAETLASLLESRRRDYNPVRYSLEQILNTFEPVIECLDFIHQKGIHYSNLSAQHILFFENGDIFLRDWLFNQSDSQDTTNGNKNTDMRKLGQIIASLATLLPQKQIQQLPYPDLAYLMMQSYSANFCAAVLILFEGHSKYYASVLSLLGNQSNDVKIPEIKLLIDQANLRKSQKERQKQKYAENQRKKEKLLKEVENQKSKIQTPQRDQIKNMNATGSIQGSPTKKFNITTPNKKVIRLQDCENKKVFNEEVKKRQIQKITKIIERSNAFVNELMARKNNDKKIIHPTKTNNSMMETQENARKIVLMKESPKIGSPSKRLRSISKKK